MNIVFSPEAEADLQAGLDYLRERNPAVAIKLAEQVFAALELLASGEVDGPEHRLTTGEVVRSWLVLPYRLFYQRTENELRVLRLYHRARRPIT
ncbi:MAG TPA: hypothetical protein DFS52_00315 [Myxococcales bacterium]|jgi:plasmid stabilization system protein ParE|nr:hypothetical protein [Myxococcales bacterium]